MTISIGNDHAGTAYKKLIVDMLKTMNLQIIDHGTDSLNSVDYPDFAHPVAQDIASSKADFGIVICGSGNGVAMTVNKYPSVRAALCWTKEISVLARQHNDANVIAIPARFTSQYQVLDMVQIFIETPFDHGRHDKRVQKICI